MQTRATPIILLVACVIAVTLPARGQSPVVDWIAHHDSASDSPKLDVDQWGNVSVVERAALSSGLYFYRLTAGNFAETRKLILVK